MLATCRTRKRYIMYFHKVYETTPPLFRSCFTLSLHHYQATCYTHESSLTLVHSVTMMSVTCHSSLSCAVAEESLMGRWVIVSASQSFSFYCTCICRGYVTQSLWVWWYPSFLWDRVVRAVALFPRIG